MAAPSYELMCPRSGRIGAAVLRVDINPCGIFDMPLRGSIWADALDMLCEARGIYIISSFCEAETYRICRKANISSLRSKHIDIVHLIVNYQFSIRGRILRLRGKAAPLRMTRKNGKIPGGSGQKRRLPRCGANRLGVHTASQ